MVGKFLEEETEKKMVFYLLKEEMSNEPSIPQVG
jgi:hypothetical protein